MPLFSRNSDPFCAADRVLRTMCKVNSPQVRGIHDAHMAILDGKAYIVYEANDRQPGENHRWECIYCALSVVDIRANRLERVLPFALSEQVYRNHTLPKGCCFVPRILVKDDRTLRVFFASIPTDYSQQTLWYLDYHTDTQQFEEQIFPLYMEADSERTLMQPRYFYRQACRHGFHGREDPAGLYLFELGKKTDGRYYVAVNNFLTRQNALGVLNDRLDTVRILGNILEPQDAGMSESGITRLPDGSWLAILRSDLGDLNYYFAKSPDGIHWERAQKSVVTPGGSNSKPLLEKIGNLYFMGWQQQPGRTLFHIDLSENGVDWERAFSFRIPDGSFQYPTLYAWNGSVYICATQGDKTSIWFGKLMEL